MEKLDPKAVWIFYLRFMVSELTLLIFIPILIFLVILRGERDSLWWIISLCYISWFGFIGFRWNWAKLSYNAYKYQLAEDAFKKEYGVIRKRYTSIPYERIQNVDIRRGILARILGLSDLMIQTAGSQVAGRGMMSEGFLPGLSEEKAEEIREELIKRAREKTRPGL